uniref:Protein Aster-A isoform X2 n=1 Tax=Geotrypetes seraphini TaxID=260995 RepID=A0A6P8NID6_GEOSA|nr:protein Aster-A isoform X2 [Geotrypetes seraphini]
MFDTANNSPRSTPNSSPALRKRLLLTSKPFDPDTMVEKGSDSSSEKTSPPSMQQQSQLQPPPNNPLYYPLSGRNFIKNSKMQSWYSMLSPTYKQRNEDFRKIFKKLPDTERLIVDYSCALQRDILLQGRLYISENWICFYSNIFRWETTISIQLKNIRCIKKEKTAKLIPNAIQVCTESDKHFFTSFGARDRSFLLIFRLWQNALLDKTLSPQELWHIVHQCYGSELGLTSEDEDYVSPGIQFNGLGNSEDIPDVIELMDTASHCGTDGKLDSCPLLDQASVNQSFGSLASSESLASFAEDSEEPMERAADASSSQTVTPLPEPCRPGLLLDSLPPLDLPNSEELPTDMSDDSTSSTTQDEGELSTFSSDLPGRLFINSTFHISADRLQQILFSKSQFIQDFLEQRKFTDLVLKPWSRESSTKQNRVISYTIPINNPLGPKTASVVETQILYKCSQKSSSCVVDSEVMTRGIPYQDYFYTAHRYYITSLAKGKSQLRVSSEIRYKKQPWNLVKALIEKNTWNGIEDYFHYLEEELSKAEKLWLEEPCGKEKLGFLSSLRRRKRTLSWKSQHGDAHTAIDMLEEEKGSRGLRISASASSHLSDHLSERGTVHSVSTVLLIISIVLVILVVLNMMLFYRLWSLEHTAHTFQTWQSYALSKGKFPQTSAEWAEILELQKRFHSVEVQKWKQILKASVELLDEMKSSLEKLQQGIVVTEPPLENEKRQG